MRILVLASFIGKSAAGIVFASIIEGIRHSGGDVLVICNTNNRQVGHQGIIHELRQNGFRKKVLIKLALIFLSMDLTYLGWARKIVKKFKRKVVRFTPEKILVLCSASDYEVLKAGLKFKTFIPEAELHLHCVDAMPSPIAWGEHRQLRNARIRYLVKRFNSADVISFTNEVMLQYQKSIYGFHNTHSLVIHNPMIGEAISQKKTDSVFTLSYIGSLGGKRNAQALLGGFRNVVAKYDNIKLVFVGTNSAEIVRLSEYTDCKDKVELIGWTEDVDSFIRNSDVLIDIDADIESDVFISSKLIKYLNTSIPILCITRPNSPSDQLIKGRRSSVFTVPHDETRIAAQLMWMINRGGIDARLLLQQRMEEFRDFRTDTVVNRLLQLYKG